LWARYLAILGLDPRKRYSQTEIKAAFRKAAKTAHPHVRGSSEAMREVLAAYDRLTRAHG
jgi:curved DNA-binding protein CbpA